MPIHLANEPHIWSNDCHVKPSSNSNFSEIQNFIYHISLNIRSIMAVVSDIHYSNLIMVIFCSYQELKKLTSIVQMEVGDVNIVLHKEENCLSKWQIILFL